MSSLLVSPSTSRTRSSIILIILMNIFLCSHAVLDETITGANHAMSRNPTIVAQNEGENSDNDAQLLRIRRQRRSATHIITTNGHVLSGRNRPVLGATHRGTPDHGMVPGTTHTVSRDKGGFSTTRTGSPERFFSSQDRFVPAGYSADESFTEEGTRLLSSRYSNLRRRNTYESVVDAAPRQRPNLRAVFGLHNSHSGNGVLNRYSGRRGDGGVYTDRMIGHNGQLVQHGGRPDRTYGITERGYDGANSVLNGMNGTNPMFNGTTLDEEGETRYADADSPNRGTWC